MADLTPGPYELALLALAAARTWKLIADDTVLEGELVEAEEVDDEDGDTPEWVAEPTGA